MQSVTLHQALHGYKDGHRKLGSSIELGAQDTKTLLILSDVSGPGSRLDSLGYLTGYPLPNSGLYALARTWPAPEMPRPGCVWTHTLLINFADLATITDPYQLLQFFRRPDAPESATYKKTMTFDEYPNVSSVNESVAYFAKPLIAALYQHPTKPVISFEEGSEISEKAVLALWAQQWPRLRRSFRFCTLATSDRSTKETLFDLQLLPHAMLSLRSRFSNVIEASHSENEQDWLNIAVNDLLASRPDGLRQFLFQAGSDLQNGRSSFATLCRIFDSLDDVTHPRPNVETALALIPKPSDSSIARALKALVVRRLFKGDLNLSEPVMSYMVDHLELLDNSSSKNDLASFGHSLLKTQPNLFLRMGESGDLGKTIFREVIASTKINHILSIAKKVSNFLPVALQVRPVLLQETKIWSLIDASNTETIDQLKLEELSQKVLCAAIKSERLDLAGFLLERVSSQEMLTALHQAFASEGLNYQTFRRWLEALATPVAISTFFFSQKQVDRRFLLSVSQLFSPDEIPNDRDEDPWLRAIEASKNMLSDQDELWLRCYLLARGLGNYEKNSPELTQFGFELTDKAAAENRLRKESWSQLENRLPWPMFWQDWDKCHRLRKGVVDHCIDNRWSANVFINLTQNDELFALLVSIADVSYRGRQYLKTVKDSLKGNKDPFVQRRRSIIKT